MSVYEQAYQIYKQADNVKEYTKYAELISDIDYLDTLIYKFNDQTSISMYYGTDFSTIADVIKSLANKYQDELDELHCFLASPGESMKRKQKPPEKYYRDEAKSLSYCLKMVFVFRVLKSIRYYSADKVIEKMKNGEQAEASEVIALVSKVFF